MFVGYAPSEGHVDTCGPCYSSRPCWWMCPVLSPEAILMSIIHLVIKDHVSILGPAVARDHEHICGL